MGFFGHKKEEKNKNTIQELPRLPELPKLENSNQSNEPLPQLPSFPKSGFGEKFSQNAIKEAVTGRKEVDEGMTDSESEDNMNLPMPSKEKFSKDIYEEEEIPQEWKSAAAHIKKTEPVFVRIDKFEQTLKTFEKAREKVTEIESMLKNIKKLKESEDKELAEWARQIQTTKEQIERVDKEIFSKIE